jgi:glycosyltransferase involved in cell wall biosynthesis
MCETESRLKKNLIIISLLDGKGPTGVEMHFNQLISEARAYGVDAQLVSPYPSGRAWTKPARLAVNALRLISRERSIMLGNWIDRKVVESKLTAALASLTRTGEQVTLYPQDTISASAALTMRKRFGCRIVSVVHYNISEAHELVLKAEAKVGGPLWRSVMKNETEALSQVDQIIFVSDVMRRLTLERLPQLMRVPHTVIPNFVSKPKVEGNPEIIADLIAIGTLEPRKNQEFLLRVLARTNALGCRYKLTLVGDGPDRAKLVSLAKELKLENQVQFLGFQPNAAALIARHRLLVHAARFESFGIVLVEALSLSRPVLAPAVGGITEVFRHGVEGFYWDIENVDESATLLVKALSEPETYRRMSEAAQIRYQKNFDSTLLVHRWLATIFDQRISETAVQQHASPVPLGFC